jgi:aspartyl protease family protein
LLVAVAVGFWAMMELFPGELHGSDWTSALRLFGLLALVSSGIVAAQRVDLGRTARMAAVWALIVLALLLGYSYRGELGSVAMRLRSAIIPAYAAETAPRTVMIEKSEEGGFYVRGDVNGTPVRFAIDTGASDIVLSPDDARRVGIDPTTLKYSAPHETANGVGYSAGVVVSELKVGPISLKNVLVSVNQQPMSSSLLGMSFLRQIDSLEIHGDQLFLKAKT